jgi:4'-phosphopantetheinyl transferase
MPPITVITADFEQVFGLRGPIEASVDCVDVWLVSLEASDSRIYASLRTMPDGEIARAERFLRRGDRDQHVVSRGLLRRLLSLYCQMAPTDIKFETGADGKPSLEPGRRSPLTFNLSHSAGRMLVGISRDRSVGVDIEARGPGPDPLKIATRYFFGAEAADIAGAPEDLRQGRFLQYWVAKEAALKAAGVGLRYPLDALRVRFSTDRTEADVESLDRDRLAPDFTVRMLTPGIHWHAAVASRGREWRCRPMPPGEPACAAGSQE